MPGQQMTAKRGAEDAGRYFRYLAEFVGLTAEDADIIRQTRPVIEKHLPDIVARFYSHLLRYPPTRKFFLKPDGSIDQDYVALRMRHLINFWLRTAGGVFDDDYARYVDYVGRAHTSRGADPRIYIAERYVIGQVGFMQNAISEALFRELMPTDQEFALRAEEAWDKLLMVVLELLARAYGTEREAETFDPLVAVDGMAVQQMAEQAFALEHGEPAPVVIRETWVAHEADIPERERKIVSVGPLSIGIFHHEGKWRAVRNSCLHRGGPVATGALEGNVLTCPWHGFQYDIVTGQLLVDPSAALDMYPVLVCDGEIYLQLPESAAAGSERENEFCVSELPPGHARRARLRGRPVAVFNTGGGLYATQAECTHMGGPLDEGQLDGCTVTCPWHGSRFDVSTGAVLHGPAQEPLVTYRVVVEGDAGRVEG